MSKKEIMFEILRERYSEIPENAKIEYYERNGSIEVKFVQEYENYHVVFSFEAMYCELLNFYQLHVSEVDGKNVFQDVDDFWLSDCVCSENYSPETKVFFARINAADKERG